MTAPASAQALHQLGGQDLRTVRRSAESRRLDYGGTEAVAVLQADVTGRQADPDGEGRLGRRSIVGIRRLLDGHGGADRVRGAGEHGQDPVSEALDDCATLGLDHMAEQLIVGPANLVSALFAQANPQLRRPGQVRDEDGRRL